MCVCVCVCVCGCVGVCVWCVCVGVGVCVLSFMDCYYEPRIFPYDGNGCTIGHALCLLEL